MAKGYCYIQQMEDQRGENWIFQLRPDDIQNSTKRIVKDMIKGNISYEKHGYAFLDSKFLENLFIGCSNELEINTLDYNACKFYQQYYPFTPNINAHIAHLEKVCNIYNTILPRLDAVRSSGNIGYLVDIQGLLYNDRNHIN